MHNGRIVVVPYKPHDVPRTAPLSQRRPDAKLSPIFGPFPPDRTILGVSIHKAARFGSATRAT